MFKVGQRVRILKVENSPIQRFARNEVEFLTNKIVTIRQVMGELRGGVGYQVESSIGLYNFMDYQFRALKKKKTDESAPAFQPAKVAASSMKEEVGWLNKVQRNFKNAGELYDPHRDIQAVQYRRTGNEGDGNITLERPMRPPPQRAQTVADVPQPRRGLAQFEGTVQEATGGQGMRARIDTDQTINVGAGFGQIVNEAAAQQFETARQEMIADMENDLLIADDGVPHEPDWEP